jgi:hypothetical protein
MTGDKLGGLPSGQEVPQVPVPAAARAARAQVDKGTQTDGTVVIGLSASQSITNNLSDVPSAYSAEPHSEGPFSDEYAINEDGHDQAE